MLLSTLAKFVPIRQLRFSVQVCSVVGIFAKDTLICLLGPVGLLTMAVAKAFGAKRIIAIDIVQSRLEFAKSYAATDIYLPSAKSQSDTNMLYSRKNAADMKEKLGLEDRGEKGVDIAVDASGAEVSIQTSICLAKEGGQLVVRH